MSQEYEDLVLESAETRRDLDTILHPTYACLKKIFVEFFPDFTKTDFKKACDLVYYQGGYPRPTSLPKAEDLADYLARTARLLHLYGHDQVEKLLKQRGVTISIEPLESGTHDVPEQKMEAIERLWVEAGIEGAVPATKRDVLRKLVDRAQSLQREICQQADTIKVEAAAIAEETHKISKKNFVKAVQIAALKLRKGEGRALEQIEKIEDEAENFSKAVEPLRREG